MEYQGLFYGNRVGICARCRLPLRCRNKVFCRSVGVRTMEDFGAQGMFCSGRVRFSERRRLQMESSNKGIEGG